MSDKNIATQTEQTTKQTDFMSFLGTLAKFFRLMKEQGIEISHYQDLIDNTELRVKIARYWKNGGYTETVSQKLAKEIMGKNFLGIDDVMKYYGVSYSKKQLAILQDIDISENELREKKDTHILFPGFPMTILDIRDKAPTAPQKTFYRYEDAWYNSKKFAKKEQIEVRWHLIRKDCVPDSKSRTYQEQVSLLKQDETPAKAVEMVYMIVLYFLTYGVRLFEKEYARCSDTDPDDTHVSVGNFDSDGLGVYNDWDDDCRGGLGLSSARKFQD